MLVLTRKQTEMIRIGDDIVIKVIKTGKGAVKIGVEAPAHVRVLRAELCDNIKPFVESRIASRDNALHGESLTCSDQYPYPHIA